MERISSRDASTSGDPDPLLVTVAQAGRMLNVGRSKIYELLSTRRLQGVKIDKSWRVRVSSIHRLVNELAG